MTVCSLQFYLSLPTTELGHYSHLQNNFQIFIIIINYVKIQTLNAYNRIYCDSLSSVIILNGI